MNNLPEGPYQVFPRVWGTRETSKGSPYVGVDVAVTHHIKNGEVGDPVDPPLARTIRLFLTSAAMEFATEQLRILGFNGNFGDGMGFADDVKTNGFAARMSYRQTDSGTYENWNVISPDKRAASNLIDNLNREWKRNAAEPDAPPATETLADGIPF